MIGKIANPSDYDFRLPTTMSEDLNAIIKALGPRDAFQQLIEESNALIKLPNLDNGREIVESRCAIYYALMANWAAEQVESFGYTHPFAVVALGGTGRNEMTPCSDTDFALLFDGAIEGNKFLESLQEQTIQSKTFRNRHGFDGTASPFNFDDVPKLKEKQLNAFLDMRPIYDPQGLTEPFRERIRGTYDRFEHFLHVSEAWRANWGAAASKNEQLNSYDIKTDGLRVFQAGIWTLAGKDFRHSHEIYRELKDQRDLDAYYFLLRIRSFIHLYKNTRTRPTALGLHKEDLFGFSDFMALGELAGADADEQTKFEFATEVRSRFLEERRRVGQFTWGVIGGALQEGRIIRPGSAIVYGTGGLRDTASNRKSKEEKSRAAFAVVLAAQRYGLPIDPVGMQSTFRDAGDWIMPVPELVDLFYESRGSLADSMKFLAQLPGALDRVFPGYAKLESSIDTRVMEERKCLRGALLREKLRALERDLKRGYEELEVAIEPNRLKQTEFDFRNEVEAALLDDDHLAAIRLALFTKRLPQTAADVAARANTRLPLHLRFSCGLSGVDLNQYYEDNFLACGFPAETLEIAKFLVVNRRAFKEAAANNLITEEQVAKIVDLCSNESRLRALYVFTSADRTEWESANSFPGRWFIIREIYVKSAQKMSGKVANIDEKLTKLGFDREQLEVLRDFGKDFFGGTYWQHAGRFGGYLLSLLDDHNLNPYVSRIRIGSSDIFGIATLDQPGIAASISGAFWKLGVPISQAHFFSASRYGLALDFFHLAPPPSGVLYPSSADISQEVAAAIVEKKYISLDDEINLPDVAINVTLSESGSELYQLRAETDGDVGALIYYLACKAFRRLRANIFGIAAHTGKDRAWASVYLRLPPEVTFEDAICEVNGWGNQASD